MLTPVFFQSNRYHCLQGVGGEEKAAKFELLSLGWIFISITSMQSQSKSMVFPYSPHLLQQDIGSIKSSFLRQVSTELKTSQAIFPLYPVFIFRCHHFISNQIRCLQWSCLWLGEWGAFLPKHTHTPISTNHRAATPASKVLKIRGYRRAQKKKDVLQKSNILPQLSILCKMLVLQNCIFNCCYIN